MTAPPTQSAPADQGGRQGQDASHRHNATTAADRQSCEMEAAERAAIQRLELKKHRRQEVADRLAEARLELTLLEIEIRRAELAELRKGGRHE